jgi:hypothetical protein
MNQWNVVDRDLALLCLSLSLVRLARVPLPVGMLRLSTPYAKTQNPDVAVWPTNVVGVPPSSDPTGRESLVSRLARCGAWCVVRDSDSDFDWIWIGLDSSFE